MLADTQQVDNRVKTFADEAIRQLEFLKDQYGFAGPDVDRGTRPGTPVSVSYNRDSVTIEASLILRYMGEEYVATTRVVHAPDGTARRAEIAHNTAHTGYQMRRALKLQAEAVRAEIHKP
jgi:hypothetical protein